MKKYENDLKFANLVLSGNQDKQTEFYNIISRIIHHIASNSNITSVIPSIDDIVHDFYVHMVLNRKLARYSGRAKLSTFLYVSAYRFMISRVREERRIVVMDPPDRTFEVDYDMEVIKGELKEAIARLSDEYREVFMFYIDGYRSREIAELLGIRRRRVEKILEKGKLKIRKMMLY